MTAIPASGMVQELTIRGDESSISQIRRRHDDERAHLNGTRRAETAAGVCGAGV
jgi:hypothetical protein